MSELNTIDRRLMERVEANFMESYRVLARLAPRGAIEEADGLITIATGIPAGYFNPAFVTRQIADPTALADRLHHFYRRAGMPGLLIGANGTSAEPTAALVHAAGLSPDDPLPMMILEPLPDSTPPGPPALVIDVVSDPATLRIHNELLGAAMRAILDDPAILRVVGMTLYVGLIEDEPVAHALRFTSHGIAGIYNVGTLPHYRRRGLGAAMTWRAALDGRGEGCIASALQSSPMAFSLYRRMGYRHVADYPSWVI